MRIDAQRRAAIRRAAKAARESLRQQDASTSQQLEAIYTGARRDIEATIRTYGAGEETLRLQVLRELRRQIDDRLAVLATARDELFGSALREAAETGAGPWVAAGLATTGVADDALRIVIHQQAADGLQLSERIWRMDRGARELVGNAIEQAVIQGSSASRAAQDFLARGVAVPAHLQAQIAAGQIGSVARLAGGQLMTGEGNAYYNALRLFRTEINRAHGEAYRAAAFEHDEVVGTRFLLSPRHRKTDICDMHARANRYGLGPGVYPKGRSPWPAHPNTLSFEEVVFADEISDEDKEGSGDRIEWLRSQSAADQLAILGSEKKRAALQAGHLTEQQIGTPWRVLRRRYERQGIDVDRL